MTDIATDPAKVRKILTDFIADEIGRAGMENAVLGLSGGVDSSLVANLAAEALGPARVLGLIMPYKSSTPESRDDAKLVAGDLGIRVEEIDISPQADAFLDNYAPDASPVRRGNVMARMRMICLFDRSAAENALVLGTSNKTEMLLGYGTVYGDLACGINPLGDLYKTRVRQLAAHVGVPERIIAKAPSADLWPDQTDEDDLGFSYDELDEALYRLIDLRQDRASLADEGFKSQFIDHVCRLVEASGYKRCMPPIAKLSG